jgi:hypothetical protein
VGLDVVWPGVAGWGQVWPGLDFEARHGKAWRGQVWCGLAGHGGARRGRARRGEAWISRLGAAWSGLARLALDGPGEVRLGAARLGARGDQAISSSFLLQSFTSASRRFANPASLTPPAFT